MCHFSIKRCFVVLLLALTCLLYSCSYKTKEQVTSTALKLNTVVSISIYDTADFSIADEALSLIDKYDLLFSRTNPDSELYKLNHGQLAVDSNNYASVSPETYEIISLGKYYANLSGNTFDIAIEPLTSLWDFSSEKKIVPSKDDINSILPYLSPDEILLSSPDKIKLADANAGIDLGGIAKGYIADKTADYLKAQGVTSAIINLGGNVLCIGNKENQPFTVGIQKPFAPQGEYLATIQVTDKSVVSSGIYERYFEKDDVFYHHILNPKTGYPYQNDLIGVTIITDSSTDADALSTTCFSLGLKDGLALIESIDNADALFIDSNYNVHYSENFKEKYNLVMAD